MAHSVRSAGTARPAPGEPIIPASVAAVVEALSHARVHWCLLRDVDPNDPTGDVDLLVPAAEMPRAASALEEIGFIERSAWGYEPHRFFFRVGRGGVLKLDVVTELRYGDDGFTLPGLAERVLRRAAWDRGAVRPNPSDEFWTLLLHAALDKTNVAEHRRARLAALAVHARTEHPPEPMAADDAARIIDAVESGRWDAAGDLLRSLASSPASRGPWMRTLRRRLGWRLRPLRRRGATVALLGPDGAGKTTIADVLARDFPIPVRRIYMGLYRTARRRLPPGLSLLSRVVLQWVRYTRAAYHRARGRVVLFDRYTDDAAIPTGGAARRDGLRRRILARAVPRPDLTLVLDAPAAELLRRKGEHGIERLEAARLHYRAAAERARRGAVIDATRPPEAVAREAAARIWDVLGART